MITPIRVEKSRDYAFHECVVVQKTEVPTKYNESDAVSITITFVGIASLKYFAMQCHLLLKTITAAMNLLKVGIVLGKKLISGEEHNK